MLQNSLKALVNTGRQLLKDINKGITLIANGLLGNRQASAQLRLGFLVISVLILWGLVSYRMHPYRIRAESWRTVATFFQSLFAADVLSVMLTLLVPMIVMLRLAAIYLDDIFELQDIGVATKFILQAAFAIRYQTVKIRNGEIDPSDVNTPLMKIGGPGYVRVDFENAAVFERIDGTARIVTSSKKIPKRKHRNLITILKILFWIIGSVLTGVFGHQLLINPQGIAAWVITGVFGGITSWVLANLFSIMIGGFIGGLFAQINSRVPGGIWGAAIGGVLIGSISGMLSFLFAGDEGWIVGLIIGIVIIAWQTKEMQIFVPIDGFERVRAIVDLRPQKKVLKPIRTRTRDGVEIVLEDVQVIFSVYRPNPHPLSFDEDAIIRLIYREGKQTWIDNAENRISVLLRAMINQTDLFNLLSASGDGTNKDVSQFVLREEIINKVMQDFNRDAKNKGVQLEWIGLGTWKSVLEPIKNDLLELWKASTKTKVSLTPGELKIMADTARYQELKRLALHPYEIFKRYKAQEQADVQIIKTAGIPVKIEKPKPEDVKYEYLLAYREKLYRAWEIYTSRGEEPPGDLVKALGHLNYLVAYKP